MPLTINLLHEEQYLLQQRKRDPLKLGLYALAGVAALFVMYYGWRFISSSALSAQVRVRQAEWAKQEPAANAAAAQERDVTAQVTSADVVGKRIENRFYWAPLLETVVKNVPSNVQLIVFVGDNDAKTSNMHLTIEGIVAGDVPRLAADRFRTALTDTLAKKYTGVATSFRSLEDAPVPVTVNGRSTPTAHFTIEVLMNKPGTAPAATPAPERRKHP